jgi:Tfp pilus assembly PilM family ATPase
LARLLALDWDHHQLHVVAATSGARLRIQHAVVWSEELSGPHATGLTGAEALGKHLRERLNAAGIAPGGVLACVGRERVIVKEVRYPAGSDAEEAALVRFQAAKELTDAPDDVVIDYLPLGETVPNRERRAAAIIVRRDLLRTYQTICQAAGLKLLALTPRPFGTLACWRELAAKGLTPVPDGADTTVAVLAVAERWAEFSVLHGEMVLFARALSPGAGLVGEVRRNLAVYSSQWPQYPLTALCVTGDAEQPALREQLQGMVSVPLHSLDPFAAAERGAVPAGGLGGFTAATGLLYREASRKPLSINFVRPKEPRPASDPNKRRLTVIAGVAAALLLAIIVSGYAHLAIRDRQISDLVAQRDMLDKARNELTADERKIKALDDWTRTQINWLDELYDMTDRVPDTEALRLTELTATAGDPQGRTARDKAGKLQIKGISVQDQKAHDYLINQLVQDYQQVGTSSPKGNTTGTPQERNRFRWTFATTAVVNPRPPNKYIRSLDPVEEPAPRPTKGGGRPGAGGAGEGGGP